MRLPQFEVSAKTGSSTAYEENSVSSVVMHSLTTGKLKKVGLFLPGNNVKSVTVMMLLCGLFQEPFLLAFSIISEVRYEQLNNRMLKLFYLACESNNLMFNSFFSMTLKVSSLFTILTVAFFSSEAVDGLFITFPMTAVVLTRKEVK